MYVTKRRVFVPDALDKTQIEGVIEQGAEGRFGPGGRK
jgi:hypothetical protein